MNPDGNVPADLPEDPGASYNPPTKTFPPPGGASGMETSAVARLMGKTRRLGSGANKPDAAAGGSGSQGGITMRSKIAEGGFGEVWEGLQCSLARVVAVKRMKPGLEPTNVDDPEGEQRWVETCFRQEALTAARLEHPNIVPVHDLDLDEDGRPLIAMKLVKGKTWSELIREEFGAMEAADFLGRHLPYLVAVSQAVAFAHSRGIVHRDLKPSQVLIGRFGEVLLMDWGLALAYEPEEVVATSLIIPDDLTSPLHNPINPAGTPHYMAPEQTESSPGNLGPWTDVYLLGGILYQLLTGRPPHQAPTSARAFDMARRGEVAAIDSARMGREIPGELAALAMKAMAVHPLARVGSAEAFAKGLQDFLSGSGKRRESQELVRLVEEGLPGAGQDYGRLSHLLNHLDRSLVLWPDNTGAEALRQEVLARYSSAAVASHDLKLARVQAERLEDGPVRAGLLAEIERLEKEQRRAEARLNEALRTSEEMRMRAEHLLRFMMGDLHRSLETIGRLDVLEQVAREALAYFDVVPASEESSYATHDRVVALLNIGKILSSQGRKTESLRVFQRAVVLAREHWSRERDSLESQSDLAEALDRTGLVIYQQGRGEEALKLHLEALEYRRVVHAARPWDHRAILGLSSTIHLIGICQWRRRELDPALERHGEAMDLLSGIPSDSPLSAECRSQRGWLLISLSNVHRDRITENLRAIEVAREALEQALLLVQEQPAHRLRRRALRFARHNLALILCKEGGLEEALQLFEDAMEEVTRSLEEDPTDVEVLGAAEFSFANRGQILLDLGRFEESGVLLDRAIAIARALLARDPTSIAPVMSLALCLALKGQIAVCRGEEEVAFDWAEQAATYASTALASAPGNGLGISAFSGAKLLLGHLWWRRDPASPEVVAALEQVSGAAGTPVRFPKPEGVIRYRLLRGETEGLADLIFKERERRQLNPYVEMMIAELAPDLAKGARRPPGA